MKRIIVLYGHSNCGKTETLNILRELIRENGGNSLSKSILQGGDVSETFLYKGQKICICSGGDTDDVIIQNFQYANYNKAEVFITASRTRGKGCDYINEEAIKNGLQPEWYKKSYEDHLNRDAQMYCNQSYAETLFNLL